MSEHCIVAGAGHAGGRAVEALRKHGYGGAITLVGEEQTLPFERPPLSKQYLKAPSSERLPPIRPRSWYDENGINVLTGVRVTALDLATRQLTLDGAESLNYSQLLITTGGRLRPLPVPGTELAGIHSIRGQADTDALHADLGNAQSVVVVGGGFIGLEAAAILRERGHDVTVLEAGKQLMGRAVLPEIADAVQARFEAAGVVVKTDTAATAFEGQGRVAAVCAGDEVFPCDVAIVGIGIIPDCEFAAQAGIQVDNGIVVDAYCQTSAAGVYAAGDVTWHLNARYGRSMRLESWQNAQNQAICAARNLSGDAVAYDDIPWFWSDQFDFKIQAAGDPHDVSQTVIRALDGGDLLAFQLAGNRVVGLQSLGAVKDMRRARKLLERDVPSDPVALADPSVAVKELLKT